MKTAIKQDPNAPVPTEVLASSIVAIAQGVRKMRSGRLNDRALCMLISHAAPAVSRGPGKAPLAPSQREVRAVLDGIDALEKTFLKPVKK